MVKLNSTTAILSDLDGVILNLEYDIKFWELWLPEHVASQSNQNLEEIKTKIHNISLPQIQIKYRMECAKAALAQW